MNTMSIQVSTIDVKAIDDRGALHYFSTDRTGEFLLVYRNAGTISGQHYHNGLSIGKNPEEMLLLQGEIILNWKDIQTQTIGTLNIKSPSRVIIPAKIWHEVKAITDIVFIELNSLKDGSEDTHRL